MNQETQREMIVGEITVYLSKLERQGHSIALPDLATEDLNTLRNILRELKDLARTPE